MEDITLLQAITLAIATLGAVLGIINTWASLDRMRVKVRVKPEHVISFGNLDPRLNFSISVTNLSAFAVTINEVGVFYRNSEDRGSIVRPVLGDGGDWPRRLEPRTSVTILGERPMPVKGKRVRVAYATTACGVTTTGTSPALKQIAADKANF